MHAYGGEVHRRQPHQVHRAIGDVRREGGARFVELRRRARRSPDQLNAWRDRLLWLVALPLLLGSFCPTAFASGFGVARFGGEHGTVVATNPTALYYNPAAIGFSEGAQLFVDGSLALRSMEWTHAAGEGDAPEPAGFEGANYGRASATNVFGGPMLGGSIRSGDFAFGAAVYAPFGGELRFDRAPRFENTDHPGAADGVARWHAYEASTTSIYATLGAAYRLGPVSLGAAGNLIFSSLAYQRAQSTGVELNELDAEGRSRLDVSGVNGSFGVGAMLEAVPDTLWIGASYQAQPGLGLMELDGKLVVRDSTASTGETLERDVTLHQALPDVFRLGVRFKPSSTLELRLAGDLTRWSVLQTQCVSLVDRPCNVLPNGDAAPGSGVVANQRLYWHDTVGVRGGASYWVIPRLELFAGAGFETASTPDETLDPVLADADNLALALGGRLGLGDRWFIALSYTHLQFLSRDTSGKSALADPEIQGITRRPDGGGEYEQWIGVLNANLLVEL